MKKINITPSKTRVPIAMPKAKQIIEALDYDDRMKYIYSGLAIADTIDGLVLELINDTENAGLFRQGFKGALNEMRKRIESYKVIMFRSSYFNDNLRQELSDNLDKLDDSFNHDMKILFHSIKRYVEKFIGNTDHATCIARASVIELLSQYSIINDTRVSNAMSNVTGRNIHLEDYNIKGVNFQSRKYIGHFASMHGEMDINLNDCDEVYTAFDIINKKMNRIHELIKQTA